MSAPWHELNPDHEPPKPDTQQPAPATSYDTEITQPTITPPQPTHIPIPWNTIDVDDKSHVPLTPTIVVDVESDFIQPTATPLPVPQTAESTE